MWQSATIPPHSMHKPGCSFPSEWQQDFWSLKEQTPWTFLVSVLEWSTDWYCRAHKALLWGQGSGFHCPTKYIHTTEEVFNLFLATCSNLPESVHIPQYSFWPNFHLCFQQKARQCRAVSSQSSELLSSILKLHSKAGWPWDLCLLALPLLLAKKRRNSWSLLSRRQFDRQEASLYS